MRSANEPPSIPNGGTITSDAIAAMLGALLPEGAIICDESATTGQSFFRMRHGRGSKAG
jgi:acetolactate synthase-1/2/3 large subunit